MTSTPTPLTDADVSRTRGVVFRGVALFAAFWLLAGGYLFVYFSSDDFLILFLSMGKVGALLRGIIFFWSGDVFRPIGSLLHLGLYSLFGLHAFPFKLLMLLLFTANLLIAWRVASLLLANSSLAALTALLMMYHASSKDDIWYNFGNSATIFDIVCFTFTYSALWLWLESRKLNRFPSGRTVMLIAGLLILALDSKEIAVALPVIIFLRELFWGGLVSWNKRRIEWRTVAALGVFTLITLIFLVGKSRGASSLLNNPLYRPMFTLHVYSQNMSTYLNQLFYTQWFRAGRTNWFLVAGFALAALLRARMIAFGWLWFLISVLPVAFLPGRGGIVLYVPGLGLAIALTDLFRRILDFVSVRIRAPFGRHLDPASMPVFAVALVCITGFDWHVKRADDGLAGSVAAQYQSFAEDLRRDGGIDHGTSLLFLRDPFATDRYDPQFIALLLRKEHNLRAARAKLNQALLSPVIAAKYDNIFDFANGHLHRISGPDLPGVLDRLRHDTGIVNPVSGVYLSDDPWWWTQKDFVVETRCPSPEKPCDFAFNLEAPVPPPGGGARNVSIDVGGTHWRDVTLPTSQDTEIDIPLPASERPTQVRFRVDRASDPSQLNGDRRELAVVLSGVHIH